MSAETSEDPPAGAGIHLGLGEIQRRFYELVTAREGVGKTLAERGLGPEHLAALVVGDQRLGAVDRLDIYASMYFFRILDVLRDAYPKVVAVVGDAAFHNLVTDYLQACPPAHPNLAFAGQRFPAYLAGHPLVVEKPWIVALARLERAYTDVFDGPDAPVLSLGDLAALPPSAIMALRLTFIPCHRVLTHPFALHAAWQMLDEVHDAEMVTPDPGSETLLVWRQGIEVHHRVVEGEEAPLLEVARRGCTLEELCNQIPGDIAVEDSAQRVFQLVGHWVQNGLLVHG